MTESDEELVGLCLGGEPEAFRELVSRYEGLLLRHLTGRLGDGDDAAEAAQEVMVRAYFTLSKLRNAGSFARWLLGIADLVARETHRARRRRPRSDDLGDVPERFTSDAGEGRPSDLELRRAVAGLPPGYREVVLLRFYGGQSCAEIGRRLGLSLGTITSRLSRAYALLRGNLAAPGCGAREVNR